MSLFNGDNNQEPEEDKDFQMEQVKKKSKKSTTPTLDHFGKDLTDLARKGLIDPVIGREKELNQMIEILSKRKKNNPCLLGEAGVGKSALAELLAIKIASKDIDASFYNKRIIELQLASIVAGTKYRGMFEERMEAILKEAIQNPNVILFIDELHTLIGSGSSTGSMDGSNIFKPPLARGEIKLIGATTFDEYQKYVEKDKALERRFQKVIVEVPSTSETIQILTQIKEKYEKYHHVKYSKLAIEKIVEFSERYVTQRNNPDKSIDLMDEVGAKVKLKNSPKITESLISLKEKLKDVVEKKNKARDAQIYETAAEYKSMENEIIEKIEAEEKKLRLENNRFKNFVEITVEDIASVISAQTGIPVSNMTEKDLVRVAKMDKEIKSKVIGQDDAVDKVADAIKRHRAGISDPNKPISFMFLGSSGSGKTELTKQLAKFLFGTDESIIRLDMSEYSMKHEVSKLIGSPPGFVGFEEGGQLTERVKNKPYSVILFDEFEKAHPDFRNIMLQVLDEGFLTDAQGRKINFKNTIIIMTSNIGTSKMFEEKVGFSTGLSETRNIENEIMGELKKHPTVSPEFLNRIDNIVIFKHLSKENVRKIVDINVDILAKRLLKERTMNVKFSNSLKDYLAETGFDKMYGARPLKRAIANIVEKIISDAYVNQTIKDGDKFTVDFKGGQTIIKK